MCAQLSFEVDYYITEIRRFHTIFDIKPVSKVVPLHSNEQRMKVLIFLHLSDHLLSSSILNLIKLVVCNCVSFWF